MGFSCDVCSKEFSQSSKLERHKHKLKCRTVPESEQDCSEKDINVQSELQGSECSDQTSENLSLMIRDSVDSGVGSPSPKSTWSRGWGRRCNRRTELQKIELIKEALQELSDTHGGEIKFLYKPRYHPNLKHLNLRKSVLSLPEREYEHSMPPQKWEYQPDFFLQRAGITKDDIIDNRLPNIPEGGHCVISNGLAVDMFRLAKEDSKLMPVISKFIFTFLELKFPEPVLEKAINLTLDHIKNNITYVEKCSPMECCKFLFSPLDLPEEVCEIASLIEDSQETLFNSFDSLFPSMAGQITPGIGFLDQNNMLCTLGILNNEEPQTNYQTSTVILPESQQPENTLTQPYIPQSDEEQHFIENKDGIAIDSLAVSSVDEGEVVGDGDIVAMAVDEEGAAAGTNIDSDLRVAWTDGNQENYHVILEDDMYSVTAAVYDTAQHQQTAIITDEAARVAIGLEEHDKQDCLSNELNCQAKENTSVPEDVNTLRNKSEPLKFRGRSRLSKKRRVCSTVMKLPVNETLNTSVPESGESVDAFPSTPDTGKANCTSPDPGETPCTPDNSEAPYTPDTGDPGEVFCTPDPGEAPCTPDTGEAPYTYENQDVGGQESKRSSRVRSVPSKFKDFDTTVSLSAAKKSKISN